MRARFQGTSTHKVDPKGRVSIPADFRRVLDALDPDREPGTNPSVILLYGDRRNPWFDCYTIAGMGEIDDLIEDMDEGDPDRLTLEEHYYAASETLKVDDSGRLVLSKALRDMIGVGAELTFQARGKTFRVFSPDAPAEVTTRLGAALTELPPDVPVAALLRSKRRREVAR